VTEEELWKQHFPDEKIPGSAQPVDGKCGAKLRNSGLKELGMTRYCTKKAGMGTQHLGEGTCKWHLGATKKHSKGAIQKVVTKELATVANRLGEPEPLGPPELEAFKLASKMQQWSLILEERVAELNDFYLEDQAGVEHARAVVEMLERAWDRLQRVLEFMMKHDLKKRVVELEEHQAQLIGAAFYSIILDPKMKLSEAQIDLARNTFAFKMSEMGPNLSPTWSLDNLELEDIQEAELVE